MPKPVKYKEADIAKALEENSGFLTATANDLKITLRTLYTYFDRYPKLKQLREDLEVSILDLAESQLLENIQNGNLTAIIFFLKTRGRKRGYVENPNYQVNDSDGSDNKVNITVNYV